MKTLESLFLDELADMSDAENPQSHLTETDGHVEKAFRLFNKPARGKKCGAVIGLKEGDEIVSDNKSPPAPLLFPRRKKSSITKWQLFTRMSQ